MVPDGIDTKFTGEFRDFTQSYLEEHPDDRFIVVVGGGRTARAYQAALVELTPQATTERLDWIGIYATRLNANLLKEAFGSDCPNPVVEDPTTVTQFTGRILVAAGWKPGFSTDFDAVVLAESFGAKLVVNLTNIERVYTADPNIDPTATAIDRMSWSEFLRLTGSEWTPGKNTPFDPVAARRAADAGLTVVTAHGKNLDNLRSILEGQPAIATTIYPD